MAVRPIVHYIVMRSRGQQRTRLPEAAPPEVRAVDGFIELNKDTAVPQAQGREESYRGQHARGKVGGRAKRTSIAQTVTYE